MTTDSRDSRGAPWFDSADCLKRELSKVECVFRGLPRQTTCYGGPSFVGGYHDTNSTVDMPPFSPHSSPSPPSHH